MKKLASFIILAAAVFSVFSCRKDDGPEIIIDPVYRLSGFYFASEGQWGKNNASLGYYNTDDNTFNGNWWASLNPSVSGGLGDVVNDISLTGNYVLLTVNASNILEISDRDGHHVAAVEIPNCRMIACTAEYAYVTSYAEDGYVAKVSLATKDVIKTCATGHEPEGIAIVGDRLYVLNSCSYHTDFTGGGANETASISVIDLIDFKEIKKVSLGVVNAYSPLTLMPDGKSFFINSSGDYNGIAASSLIFNTETEKVEKRFDFGGTYADTYDGKLYIFDTAFSYTTLEWESSNCVYDPATGSISEFPVPVDTFESFGAPSGLWINPANGDIYIADKGDYSNPGYLYRFNSSGSQIARIAVGVCPGHLAWDWR
ncbi:MAG: hypothetical protein IJ151_09965 [Bacteroidales bacterium]|nr:hypothetical protein [Bacteroidales bacterium]MBQ9186177.1 hypothetical protein [Bacteroidales bacterium]